MLHCQHRRVARALVVHIVMGKDHLVFSKGLWAEELTTFPVHPPSPFLTQAHVMVWLSRSCH